MYNIRARCTGNMGKINTGKVCYRADPVFFYIIIIVIYSAKISANSTRYNINENNITV